MASSSSADAVTAAAAALSLEAATCAHCGQTAAQRGIESLLRCGKCVKEKYTVVAQYCSKACSEEHWDKEHKRWHKERREAVAAKRATYDDEAAAKEAAARQKEAEEKGDEYGMHLARGERLHNTGDIRKAEKEYQKCIKLEPKEPAPHFNLGNAHRDSAEYLLAYKAFLAAVELYPMGKQWAKAVERVCSSRGLAIERIVKCTENYSLFCECEGCKALPKRPEGMGTPEALVNMVEMVVKLRPDDFTVREMYGEAHWDLADTMPEGTRKEKAAKIPVMT